MKDFEYFYRRERKEFIARLPHEDFCDAVACMSENEFNTMQSLLKKNDSLEAMNTIIRSVWRQYDAAIQDLAWASYDDELLYAKEDALEQQAITRRENKERTL